MEWKKDYVLRCGRSYICNIKSNRYGCKKCRYNFSEFTGTYLGKVKIKPSLITYLLYYFASEISAYTNFRSELKCHLSTIERIFRLFRQTLYDTFISSTIYNYSENQILSRRDRN